MQHSTYLLVLLGCLLLSAPLDSAFGCGVFRNAGTLVVALIPELVLFLGWDLYAISRGQWSYDRRYLVGLVLPGGLPIEEALFFLVVPVCAVLTFEAVSRRYPDPVPDRPALAEEVS